MIRKREREKDPYLGHLPVVGPASARPVTVEPSYQSSSSPSPQSSCVLDARAPTPATSCFAVAASPTPSRRHGDGLDPPRPPLSLWTPSSSSVLPPSRHRTHLGAPLAVAMTTATPSPLRRAPELLHLVANPLTEPRDRKGPEQPPSSSSPSFGPGAVSVEFGHSGAPPSPLTLPTAPR